MGSRDGVAAASPEVAERLACLAWELAAEVATEYRIDAETARDMIEAAWAADGALHAQATAQADLRRLRRTAAYRAAAKRARQRIYYALRRYVQSDEALRAAADALAALAREGASAADPRAQALRQRILALHVSTRERTPDAALAEALAGAAIGGAPRSVIDVGCGVYPLLHLGEAESSIERYLALDRDPDAIRAVAAWGALRGDGALEARVWSLADGLRDAGAPTPDGRFDVALALKLVPVVARQTPHLLGVIADVPARRLLVTGSCQAMSRHRSIARREGRVLRRFAKDYGLAVVGELRTESEIGLVLERVE
jgi:hypothetical protein